MYINKRGQRAREQVIASDRDIVRASIGKKWGFVWGKANDRQVKMDNNEFFS